MSISSADVLDELVEAFKVDSRDYAHLETPDDEEGKRELLQALMNIRRPAPLDERTQKLQDIYLQARVREHGIVHVDDLSEVRDELYLWQGDITRLDADAIVNAANSHMLGCFAPLHACIDNAIHTAAGVQLRQECARQMNELRETYGPHYEQPTVVPMLTPAYNLPSKHVVHIVGPIIQGDETVTSGKRVTERDKELLAQCYSATLDLCAQRGLDSVAFCCISTGVFHFPAERAARIAVDTVEEWKKNHPGAVERIIFNVFSDADRQYYEELLGV
ncbi:protein-ADP-ribose hydrolase [Alloscardovia macacae]|uniref:Macro domain-containing protein n=1 Tax=Alloscardovia macacae TaxID=1160091 RepID=A0A261F1R2_9BIFI|nr:protein-ADP-ribose hydrolase [Alloscardovia macacae]OZG53028.1 Macro domain-containing protein [Alloscardovia macacae]